MTHIETKVISRNDVEMKAPTAHVLSVVIPAFNEENNVVPMHDRLVEALGEVVEGLEILYPSLDREHGLGGPARPEDDHSLRKKFVARLQKLVCIWLRLAPSNARTIPMKN